MARIFPLLDSEQKQRALEACERMSQALYRALSGDVGKSFNKKLRTRDRA